MFFLFIFQLISHSNSAPVYDSFKPGSWWVDNNNVFLQGHGGTVQWLEDYDCFGTGNKTGCWIMYGEDKFDPLGIHCYVSKDLYNWVDKGQSFFIHNVFPEKFNGLQAGLVHNIDNLKLLKRRSSMKAPEPGSTESDIKIAKNFLSAYVTKIDEDGNYIEFDEDALLTAYVHLFRDYTIVERPKMLYNKKYNNFVIIFHCDGPTDQDIINWINHGFPSWDKGYSYSRAMLGFAVCDSPFGPFKLVNVQRMHYVDGYYDFSKGMARDQTVFLDDDGKAYAIYSSEENRCMYVSRLDDTFTTWDVPQDEAIDGTDFKSRILSDWYREAPAVFKNNGYYYMMTSGTSGWSPNEAIYYRSQNIFGPWENMGNPCEGKGSKTTFDSQSAFFIVYNQQKGQFIYFGDQWRVSELEYSRFVWLPVELNNEDHKMTLHYKSEWRLKDWFQQNEDDLKINNNEIEMQMIDNKDTEKEN